MAKLGPQPCTNISAELSVNVTVVRILGLYLDTHQLMGSVRNRFPRNAAEERNAAVEALLCGREAEVGADRG